MRRAVVWGLYKGQICTSKHEIEIWYTTRVPIKQLDNAPESEYISCLKWTLIFLQIGSAIRNDEAKIGKMLGTLNHFFGNACRFPGFQVIVNVAKELGTYLWLWGVCMGVDCVIYVRRWSCMTCEVSRIVEEGWLYVKILEMWTFISSFPTDCKSKRFTKTRLTKSSFQWFQLEMSHKMRRKQVTVITPALAYIES